MLNFLERYWTEVLWRLTNPYCVECAAYAIIFGLLGFGYLRYHYGREWWVELKSKLRQPYLIPDLKFDVSYYIFVVLFDCIFLYLIGLSFFSLQIEIQKFLTTSLASAHAQGFFQMNGTFQYMLPLLAFFMWDFATYVSHYLHHRVPWLWEFHKLHHNGYSLNPFTAFRVHIFNDIFNSLIVGVVLTLISLPFLFLFKGITAALICRTGIFHILFQFLFKHFHHSPFFICFPNSISRFFLSPAMHHIHHSLKPEHINKNYSIVFSVWDWIFSTQYIPLKNEQLTLGFGEEKKSIKRELIQPFKNIYRNQLKKPA